MQSSLASNSQSLKSVAAENPQLESQTSMHVWVGHGVEDPERGCSRLLVWNSWNSPAMFRIYSRNLGWAYRSGGWPGDGACGDWGFWQHLLHSEWLKHSCFWVTDTFAVSQPPNHLGEGGAGQAEGWVQLGWLEVKRGHACVMSYEAKTEMKLFVEADASISPQMLCMACINLLMPSLLNLRNEKNNPCHLP